MSVCVCVSSLQYWYDGDEVGDLPVDFSIVWDGDFFIDKPANMKGTQTLVCHFRKSLLTFFYISLLCNTV